MSGELVTRFVQEVSEDPALADLMALLPQGRAFRALDLLTVGPVVIGRLSNADEQARVLDALGQAYIRAREGLTTEA